MKIRTGGPADAGDIIALLGTAIAWRYAGDDRRLVGRYRALGFTETDAFGVEQPGGPWPGQILEIRICPGIGPDPASGRSAL
jgi:hypothetical protein